MENGVRRTKSRKIEERRTMARNASEWECYNETRREIIHCICRQFTLTNDKRMTVTTTLMSRKKRKPNISSFAFIKFALQGGVVRAIKNLNGREITGQTIIVSEAKFKRSYEWRDTANKDENI